MWFPEIFLKGGLPLPLIPLDIFLKPIEIYNPFLYPYDVVNIISKKKETKLCIEKALYVYKDKSGK